MAIEIINVKEKRFGLVEQATFGTAEADTSAFPLECPPFSFDASVNVRSFAQSVGSRRPHQNEQINDIKRSAPVAAIPAFPAKHEILDYLLYGMMQAVTEGGSTPWDKTFTIPNTQPDFSASAGEFFTLFERFPGSNNSRKMADAIVRSLTLSCNPGELLMVSAEFVGRGAVTENDNPSASWAAKGNDFWYFEDIDRASINFGTSKNVKLQGFELRIANAVLPYGNDGSGNFETFGLTDWDISLRMTIGEDSTNTIRQIVKAALSGNTLGSFQIGWGNVVPGTDDGDLDLAGKWKLTRVDANAEPMLGVEIEGKLLTDAIANSPLTIVLANAVERSW